MRSKMIAAAVFAISAAVTAVIMLIRALALDTAFFTPWMIPVFFAVYAAVTCAVFLVYARDRDGGTFVCPDCGEEFSPSRARRVFAVRAGGKWYFKCPGCGERTPCRRKGEL